MKYERLTKRSTEYGVITLCPACPFSHNGICTDDDREEAETAHCIEAVYNRLAELEDKIESGKMLELPCKMKLNISDCNVDVYQIIYSGKYGYMRTEIVYGEVEAEARLKELQGE